MFINFYDKYKIKVDNSFHDLDSMKNDYEIFIDENNSYDNIDLTIKNGNIKKDIYNMNMRNFGWGII